MPRKSKESIRFTKVKKKTTESKRANMEKVRDLIDKHSHCYVFKVNNYRNSLMKQVKQHWPHSRFFMGKVKPTIVALGTDASSEYRQNVRFLSHCLAHKVDGCHRGLFFTNQLPIKVLNQFKNEHQVTTFAKTGFVATQNVILNQGILTQFVFSQEMVLRKLGLPVILKHGRLVLNEDHIVCQIGQPLKPEQCKLLELLNKPMAKFNLQMYGYWVNNEWFDVLYDENEDETNINEKSKVNHNSNSNSNNNGNDQSTAANIPIVISNRKSKSKSKNKAGNNNNDNKKSGATKAEIDFMAEFMNCENENDDDSKLQDIDR